MGSGFRISARGPREAEVLIYEDIGEGFFGGFTAKDFATDLKAVGSVDTINVHISSLGGDVHEGLAIYRRLIDHPAKVITHIDGWAASIASVIAMAGDEIRIAEAGAVMIHDASGVAIGNAAEMRSMCDLLEACSASIAEVYVARTKNDLPKVKQWMQDETWFYGKEAVDAGFADTTMANQRVSARFDPDIHKFKRPPQALMETPLRDATASRLARMRHNLVRRAA